MWFDGHLDLAWNALCGRDLRHPADGRTACIALPDLRAAGVAGALATIFTAPNEPDCAGYTDSAGARRAGRRQLAVYHALERRGTIRIVRRAADLPTGPTDRLHVVVLMEGADPLADPRRSQVDLARWHAAGLRVVGLAWARGTRFAGGNGTEDGLTAAGRALIAALDAYGIVHDVSHLSDRAFDELLDLTGQPVIASHSNCRALMGGGQRHLADRQIRAIAARNGVIGLNLLGRFLSTRKHATIEDCVRHVDHVAACAGTTAICALGSDADGGFTPDGLPKGIRGPRDFEAIATALARRGWSDADLRGFRSMHWLRFLRRALPA